MGRHKKIPSKNRKKLKACDPFNKNITSWKVQDVKKKNWVPKTSDLEDQPLSQNLKELKESMKGPDKTFPKKRGSKKNKLAEAGEKLGVVKRRYESMSSFLRRVQIATTEAVEEQKILIEQGKAGRSQEEIDLDMKTITDKEKNIKEQKKRQIQNQITKAKKERAAEAKRIEDKLKAKEDRRFARQAEKAEEEPEEEIEMEGEDQPEEHNKLENKQSKKKETKTPIVFGVSKKAPVSESLIHQKEKIAFGERYDAPPKFTGHLKEKFDPLTAKAGGKNLLLHSMLKKSSDEVATYLERDNKSKAVKEFERQRVIDAYRDMKKKKKSTELSS